MKERRVSAIKEGIVIDHIPPEFTYKILDLLDVEGALVALGNNLKSEVSGKKGVIKISEKRLSKKELNRIGILAPHATVNIIKEYEVVEKFKAEIPGMLKNIVRCFNPVCITRNEDVGTKFYVLEKEPLKIKCHYCERLGGREQVSLL